jgi:hypothetical protein
MTENESLAINYDAQSDVLTVDGKRYSGQIFRTFALCAPRAWMRFESRRDGVCTVFMPDQSLVEEFDLLAKCAQRGWGGG